MLVWYDSVAKIKVTESSKSLPSFMTKNIHTQRQYLFICPPNHSRPALSSAVELWSEIFKVPSSALLWCFSRWNFFTNTKVKQTRSLRNATAAHESESSSSDAPDASSAVILKLHCITASHGSALLSLTCWKQHVVMGRAWHRAAWLAVVSGQ